MQEQYKELWDKCLQLIRESVNEQQYNTWFSHIEYVDFSETKKILLLQLPNSYVYEYLEENFVALLSKAIGTFFGRDVRLNYRLITDKKKKTTQEVESDTVSQLHQTNAPGAANSGDMQQGQLDPQLNRQQSFNNYIEGASNKLPRTVGISIAEHPGKSTFNPFFIYGPSGCGKTHLVNAIGLRCKELYPDKRVLYVGARLFQVQYTDSVRRNITNDFINFYQSLDVLIVDDIQEWATERTVDTFFHIFNHLFRMGKQIILASDRPPVALQNMKDRLLTRFKCGLIAELEKPNVELCVDILKSKCRHDGLDIPADVIDFIASTANGSVRDLQGVINSLLAYSIVYHSNINMQLADRVIRRAVKVNDHPLTIDDILEKACTHYNVTQQNVLSRSRKREYVIVRQVSMYLAQKHTKMPASRIGQLIGNRDHSTVIHSCDAVAKRLTVDKAFAEELSSIETSLKLKL